MGNLYENSEGDVEFVSDNGVWYDLQDASTNRSNKSYDLYHVLVDLSPFFDGDFDVWEYLNDNGIDDYVGRSHGTDTIFYPDPSDDWFDYDFRSLNSMINTYESQNPGIVELFSGVRVPSDWVLIV